MSDEGLSEFVTFASHFHQDILLDHSSAEEILAEATSSFDDNQRRTLSLFLGSILATKRDEELEQFWHDSGAEIGFHGPGQLRAFLDGVRNTVA